MLAVTSTPSAYACAFNHPELPHQVEVPVERRQDDRVEERLRGKHDGDCRGRSLCRAGTPVRVCRWNALRTAWSKRIGPIHFGWSDGVANAKDPYCRRASGRRRHVLDHPEAVPPLVPLEPMTPLLLDPGNGAAAWLPPAGADGATGASAAGAGVVQLPRWDRRRLRVGGGLTCHEESEGERQAARNDCTKSTW